MQIKEVRQAVYNGTFDSSDNWYIYQDYVYGVKNIAATIETYSNTAKITINKKYTYGYEYALTQNITHLIPNHKYLLFCMVCCSVKDTVMGFDDFGNKSWVKIEDINKFYPLYSITEGIADNHALMIRTLNVPNGTASFDIGDIFYVRNVMVIDLTLIYGYNNEPTTNLDSIINFLSTTSIPYSSYAIKSYFDTAVNSINAYNFPASREGYNKLSGQYLGNGLVTTSTGRTVYTINLIFEGTTSGCIKIEGDANYVPLIDYIAFHSYKLGGADSVVHLGRIGGDYSYDETTGILTATLPVWGTYSITGVCIRPIIVDSY